MDYKIQTPIWKTRSVGLNEANLGEENTVEILYKNQKGERLYPWRYSITKEEALKYPIQNWRGNKLRIIPINNLKI